jgi:aminopeptidase N
MDQRIDNCPHSFDVLHYAIELAIDFDNQLIYGDTHILSVAQEDSLSEITLDLTVLEVDQVLSDGQALAYSYDDPTLTVYFPQAYAVGDSFDVEVIYHGHPGNEGMAGFGGFYFAGATITAFSMGVGLYTSPPSMGKYWFPCWDWPCDKATAEYRITVPDDRTAVCNGLLVETIHNPEEETTTYVWLETHQIAPHVMSVTARQFAELVDPVYDWIYYWVYPSQVNNAQIHFSNVATMMDGFIERYGPYPFDKFAFVAAPKGDMEHQTCVTHWSVLIGPNHTYDWLLAHELAHMWWGDCVSINDWRDIWLSEGFATYSEAIFHEHAYGFASYQSYVQSSLMDPVFSSTENFPIYDPDYLWGTTVYEKGAVVLHMLRHVIGDEDFFAALAAYRAAHEYGNAITPQFQEAVETVSGQALGWFFDEWIYDIGWPEYRYAWQGCGAPRDPQLCLIIDQIQTEGPIFTMPLDVQITTAGPDTMITLWVDEQHEMFIVPVPDTPVAVTLDPENWILNTAEQVAYAAAPEGREPGGLWMIQELSGRADGSVRIQLGVPRRQQVRLEIFNPTGRRVRLLMDGPVSLGQTQVIWDGRTAAGQPAASGAYFCRMTAEDGSRTLRVVLVR